uniref:vacuolar protein sorting-associated protein 13C-like isoform X1 n=1 Tax=Styela clava TaxID=7725 RepID=UPI00193977E2|nr:vacuolar protein sorting-associated protein 13C-like isoform X1 [Styela clava]
MVFESLVVDLMNKYLSAYIENLDASQLKLGIWGGDAVLENLHVKGDALKDLDLPVTIKSGFIGKLTLKIPWKNLYKDAVEATLDGLYILAVPNNSIQYDDKKENEKAEKEKQEQLKQIEEQLAKKLEKKDTAPKQDGFVEKLATQVIKNIQVSVKNIHVRYEDDVTIPGQPFALGVTLNSLALQTTNEDWVPTLLDESVKIIFKMVSLNSLAVYWNSKPKLLYSKANREEQLAEFKSTIAAEGFMPKHFTYIIKPMTLETKLRLNPHPENDLSMPKILLSVVLQELGLHLSDIQFQSLMELVESMDRMSVNAPFRKYHPGVSVKGNAKAWWKYAYNSVLEAGVTRKMTMFSWNHIKEHKRKVKAYKKLYKEKLKQKKPQKDLLDSLVKMENELDVFNITLARQSAEVEMVKSGVAIKSKKSGHQKEEESSWFGGWFGGSKKKQPEKDKEGKEGNTIDTLMDGNEKQLFYEAIGYSEGEGPIEKKFPKEYVEINVGVDLNLVSVHLEDYKNLSGASLLSLGVKDIKTTFKMRPTMDAISVEVEMKDFSVDGLEQDGLVPHIVASDLTSEANAPLSANKLNLLAVKFETNPLDESCDQRVDVKSRPLCITYDAATINNLIEFFKPPEDVQLQQIRAAAFAAYEDLREQTATGLKHAMATRKITDISVNIMSSYVVVPKNGRYVDGCEVLVLDLGEIGLKTLNEGQTPALKSSFFNDDSDLTKMRSAAYDKFLIEVKKIQLLLAGRDENWSFNRTLEKSPLHILEPLNVSLLLQKCVMENDASLPKLKVEGELPLLSLKMSDVKLHNVLDLATSIPLPPPGPEAEAFLVEYDNFALGDSVSKSDMKNMDNVFGEQYSSNRSLNSSVTSSEEFFTAESDVSDIDEVTAEKMKKKRLSKQMSLESKEQLTDVQASFIISKISIGILQHSPSGDKEILQLAIANFGASATVRTWDTKVNAYLESIRMEYMQGRLPDGSPMYILNTPGLEHNSKLLDVNILIAKRIAPDFATTYENTEQKLDIKFSVLEINANSKALLEIKAFAEKLVPSPKEVPDAPETIVTPDDSKSTVTLVTPMESATNFGAIGTGGSSGSDGSPTTKKKRKKKKTKKKKVVKESEIINMKLQANLRTFAINLSDEKRQIASVAIEGIEASVSLLPSRVCIEAKLHNLLVIDPLEESLYHHIVSAEGEDVFNADIVNYNNATAGDGYSDMEKVDTSVKVKLGSLRVVFVKRFVDTMIKFAENFQDVKEVAMEAGEAAQKAASKSMMKLVERNPRIKLDVVLSVPKIHIPRNSKSLEVVAADLGNVKLSNYFTIIGSEESETPAVCENMKVEVTDIKVALCQLNDVKAVTSEYQILEPVSASIDLKRNLAASWFHDAPDISLTGSMQDINVKISAADMIGIMGTLNENLTEMVDVPPPAEIIDDDVIVPVEKSEETAALGEKGMIAERSDVDISPGAVWDKVVLAFDLPKIKINLYNDQQREHSLAEFVITTLGLNLRMGSDESMDLNVRLGDITLEDMRSTHQAGITKHITRKLNRQQSPETYKYVVHANLVQKADGSMNIDATIGSLQIILCLEFILKITNFFLDALPKDTASKQPVTEVAIEETIKKAESKESLLSEATTVVPRPHEPETSDGKSKAIHIAFKLYQPDIILVTDITSSNCQALVLSMRLDAKVDISESGREQKLSGAVSSLQLICCPFTAIQNITDEYKKVIAPCDINVNALISDTVQEFSVVITKIQITATPMVITTIAEAVAVLSTESKSETSLRVASTQAKIDIWDTKKIADMHFWFIESPEDELKTKRLSAMLDKVGTGEKKMSEMLKLSVPNIMIQLESGQGQHTVPLLITELKVNGEVKNWSGGQMEGNFKLALGVVYFNESLSVWEPLVEPVESNPGGFDSKYELWMVEANIQQNAADENRRLDSVTSNSIEEDLPPLMSVSVTSGKILHTTITNDALKVINSLARAFSDAAMTKSEKKKNKKGMEEVDGIADHISGEAKIHNMLNQPLNISLGSDLKVVAQGGSNKTNDIYTLEYKGFLAVDFKEDDNLGVWELLSSQERSRESDGAEIRIAIPGSGESAIFDISKTGTKMHTLKHEQKSVNVVCLVESNGGIRTVTLRSPLVINNHISIPVQILNASDELIGEIAPEDTFPLPTKFTEGEKLFIQPYHSSVSVKKAEIDWKKLANMDEFSLETVIKCEPGYPNGNGVNLNIEVVSEQVASKHENDTCYEIHVRPIALFRNYLPYDIEYCIASRLANEKPGEFKPLTAGHGNQVYNAELKHSTVKVKIQYLDKTWTGEVILEPDLPELSVWTFKDDQGNYMVLGKQVTYTDGYMKMTLYSPYWMVNETGFPLDYKAGEDNISQHPEEKQDFILFSFTSKSFLQKNKLQLRVCNSNFSDSFSIDAVGSNGTITCKTKTFNYIIGTKITLTSFGLTKIVTFSSYYTIMNKSSHNLEIFEVGNDTGTPVVLNSQSKCFFWPESKTDQIHLRLKGNSESVSTKIRYSKLDSGVLVKVGEIPLFIDISVTESSVTVTIKNYYVGSSAVLLVNDTNNLNIGYSQVKGVAKTALTSGNVDHYLWPEPTSKREITWKIQEGGKEITHGVVHEIAGEMKFKIDGKERVVYYAVFIDGLQRVLLFTENKKCADAVEQGLGTEQANMEVNVSLQGLSCSITDTKAKREVMYMAITSSGIVWEEKPKKRWTALPLKYGTVLEQNYQKTNQTINIVEHDKYEFDMSKMRVVKPHKAELRRFFAPGIWLQYTVSDHQVMVHAKINRVQVDNQLSAAVFPVVLNPIPLPKTIAIDSSPKPFVEVSLMQRTSEHQTFTHIKYFKVLVQEFSVKLDMGFISALLPVFGADEVKSTPQRDLKYFNYDITNAKKIEDQSEDVMADDSGIAFYDVLHLSPIKVHVSFSMQNTSGGEGDQQTNVVVLPFNALAVVLKSVGVTVSDIDDVVFKLGYFERQYQFFNSVQFQSAITMHYAGQAIKQLYVLVFGLDVIGNPYGLVMGIAEGVTDLFYEPYQGMIQGPGEFAEGLALGAMSLLGHTVGGAAGAVSRVTGALGKGVASLTMDDEYKKKRQMQKNKPTDLKEGLARGGKGFVMGFVGGVTGVVTKPMEGAKKEGAAGFFKGMGKGLVGIVARPASGIIDLASNTFEGIQKLADMSEDVKRMRPARWINEDTGILQPYKLKKAQGKAILLDVEKGKFAEGAKYIEHASMDKDNKSFLLLTDKAIIEVHCGEIFGQWNSAWHFLYADIVEEPHMAKEGIKIVGAKTKKLFGSKSPHRIVTFHNEEYAKVILDKMRRDWNAAQKGKKDTPPQRERGQGEKNHDCCCLRL